MNTDGQLTLFETPNLFRKGDQPPLGPAWSHAMWDPKVFQMPGGSTLMFDLDQLTMGDYRAMRYHPQINASIMLIVFMVHQMDWHIKCENKAIESAVEENLRNIWTRLIRAWSTSLWAGYSPNAVEWENDSGGKYTFISKIKDLLPEECSINWKMVESSYRPPSEYLLPAGTVPKVPVYDGIKKVGLRWPIPPELTFWYPFMAETGDMYGRKLLKPAFTPWYFSSLIHIYSNRYFERFGEPLPIGRAPFDEDFTVKNSAGVDMTITGKQVIEQAMEAIRSRGRVVLPSDRDPSASTGGGRSEYTYDINYLESQMRGADFERYLARLDEEMSLAIFTPMLLMRTGDIGSNALGVQHTQTWQWSVNAIVGDFKEYVDRYLCERIKDINFSPNAPKVEWVPRRLGKDNPETVRAMISGLIGAGLMKPDVDEMGVLLGLTLKEIEQVQDPNADGPKPGAVDTRDRGERSRASASGPQRVGEPLSTAKQVAARISEQVTKAWNEGKFGQSTNLSMGFRKMMTQAFVSSGWNTEDAQRDVGGLYAHMDAWLDTVKSLGMEEFAAPSEFVSLFQGKLELEIEQLAA